MGSHCRPHMRRAKFVLCIVVAALLHVSAGAAQSHSKITLDVQGATVAEVFSLIEKQSDNKFTYNNEQVGALPRVNISVKDAEIPDVINRCLGDSKLEWTLIDNNYVIRMKQQPTHVPQKASISGHVTVSGSKTPIVQAIVFIPHMNMWAATDANGFFRIPAAPTGSYPIKVSCLGFQARSFDVVITRNTENLSFQLQEMSLSLEEVVVTAKPVSGINTAARVDKTAIDHLQATSITDIMQLLPGALTTNPSLISAKGNQLAMRETKTGDGNTLGVGVIVDGAPVSNDASLSKDAISTSDKTRSLDMRTISTDNIESVEIIRGVASAEYGDMTSGGILITTRAGRSPLELRVKTDPATKAVALSKGFGLRGNAGAINVDANYAKAFSDIRTSKDAYDRITTTIGYSNTFMKEGKPLNFNLKFNAIFSKENGKADDDDLKKDFVRKGYENGVGLNAFGTWQLGLKWISNIKYTVSGRYTDEYDRDASHVTTTSSASTNTLVPGEHEAKFLLMQYYSDTRYSSKPVYGNAKITANLSGHYGKIYNKALLGVEVNTAGNVGEGRTYAGDFIPAGHRPRSFKDIPFMNRYAMFAEDKVTLPLGSTSLELMAGLRVNWMAVKGYDISRTVEPRLNGRYVMINSGAGKLSHLSVRGGWGISTRPLTLDALFPGDVYTDITVFTWSGNDRKVGVIQTFKATEEMRQNKELKNPKSTKIELGTDFTLFGIRGSVVYFNEKERNSLMSFSEYMPVSFTRYYNPDQNNKDLFSPAYEKDADGNYQLVNKAVGGAPFQTATDKTFIEISRTGNLAETDKWGIEYTLDLGRIDAMRTSVIIDGAYLNIERRSVSGESADYRNTTTKVGNFLSSNPYVGIYMGGYSMTNGSFSKRFNTNINFITHIPKLKLITSLTIQAVWMDKSQWRNDGNVYTINEDGERVYGHYYNGAPSTIYQDPVRYMDTDGKYHDYTELSASDADLKKLVNSFSNYLVNQYREDSFSPYFMANLRVTKEIGKFASLSFYAQNFTNSRPMMRRISTNAYERKNTAIYFGAELRLKF